MHVTNSKTCMAIYVSEYTEKELQGTITDVNYIRKSDSGPAQCYITATYNMASINKTNSVKMHIRNVKEFIKPEATITTENHLIRPLDVASVA